MPNWCECELTVKKSANWNSQVSLDELRQALSGERNGEFTALDENKLIPYPEKFAKMDENGDKGFNSGGYEWCIENWGTKWGFCYVNLLVKPESLFYTFETAWSPPEPLIRKMGELHPEFIFTLKYYEGGMGFKGELVVANGNVVKDKTFSYSGNKGG